MTHAVQIEDYTAAQLFAQLVEARSIVERAREIHGRFLGVCLYPPYERLAHVGGQLSGVVFDTPTVQHHAVAAAGLGFVHRLVGSIEQLQWCVCVDGFHSNDTHAHGDVNSGSLGVAETQRLDSLAQTLGKSDAVRGGHPHASDAELLAAEAAYEVPGPDRPAQTLAELAEYIVPRQVAVGIVDALEMIEVEHDERQRLTFAHGVVEFALQPLHEGSLVEHVCE